MIRMTIERRPSGESVLSVEAVLAPSFAAMPREVQTRMIEAALTRANDHAPRLLTSSLAIVAVPA